LRFITYVVLTNVQTSHLFMSGSHRALPRTLRFPHLKRCKGMAYVLAET